MNVIIDEFCCYPRCEFEASALIREPLCDKHLKSVFRSVVAGEKLGVVTVENPQPSRRANNPYTLGVVYFLRLGDRIKIGFTMNLSKRLRQVPNEEVLLTVSGNRRDEAKFHSQFSHLQIVGEWFSMGEDLLSHIEELKKAA